MKAAVVTRYGPPEVLEVRDVPAPEPGDDDVLVRVHASTVCYGDRMIRRGPLLVRLLGGVRRPKASILGADLSGTVVSVGKNVMRFAPGDEVFGSRGEKFGGYAEFACVAQNGFLAKKPATITLEEAAPVFVGGVCGPANVGLVRSLGADTVIDYTKDDFTRDGPIYDVICDVMGKSGFPASLRALRPRGRYLLIGFSGGLLAIAGALLSGAWTHLRGRAAFIAGPARPVQADLEFLKTLIEAGQLLAVIGRTFALDDIVAAHRHADTDHKVGNIVVLVDVSSMTPAAPAG